MLIYTAGGEGVRSTVSFRRTNTQKAHNISHWARMSGVKYVVTFLTTAEPPSASISSSPMVTALATVSSLFAKMKCPGESRTRTDAPSSGFVPEI